MNLLKIIFYIIVLITISNAQNLNQNWEYLLKNQVDLAENGFKAALTNDNPEIKAEAQRGLAWIAKFYGDDLGAAKHTLNSFFTDQNHNWLLADYIDLTMALRNLEPELKDPINSTLNILEKTDIQGELWAELRQEFSTYILRDYGADSARKYLDNLGLLQNWSFCGPFNNVSNSGVLIQYKPELGFNLTEEYQGLSGRKVSWNKIKRNNIQGWIRLDEHQGVPHAINYFSTSIYVPKEQRVRVSFGYSGVYKIWLNQKILSQNKIFQNTGLEAVRKEVNLKAGWNDILIKLGHESKTNSNFAMRLSDLKGQALHFKSQVRAQKKVSKEIYPSQEISSTLVSDFKKKIENSPNEIQYPLYLVRYFLNRESFSESKKILRDFEKRYPNSVVISGLLAELYLREGNTTLGETYQHKAWAENQNYYNSWKFQFFKLVDNGAYRPAWEHYTSRSARFKDEGIVMLKAMDLCFKLSYKQEGLALLDTIKNKFSQDPEIAMALATIYRKINDPVSLGFVIDEMHKFWKNHFYVSRLRFDEFQRKSMPREAREVLRKSLQYHPSVFSFYETMANSFFNEEKYDSALVWVDRGLELAPDHAGLIKRKGGIYEKAGQKNLALKAYEDVLNLDYTDYELSHHIRKMKGLPDLYSLTKVFDRDSLLEVSKNWTKKDSANSEIILDQKSVIIHPSKSFEIISRMIIKVNDSKGVDDWKEYEINSESNYENIRVLRAQTIKADGKTLEADRGGLSLVFKNLEPGDLLEIQVLRQNYLIGRLAGNMWTKMYFNDPTPTLLAYFEIISPKEFKYDVKQHKLSISPTKKITKDLKIVSWKKNKIFGSLPEEFMEPWSDALSWIQVSSIKEWGFVSQWYAELTEGKSLITEELEDLANTLFKGARSDREKIVRVHHFITNHIRYSSKSFRQSGYIPQDAFKTLATRVGDCKDMATLAKTLLKISGVSSELVLVETNDQGTDPVLPSIEFNHCILRTKNKEYIDFTASNNDVESLPRSDQGARALPVNFSKNSRTVYLPFEPWQNEKILRFSSDSLTAHGDFYREIKTSRYGNFAAHFRSSNRYLPEVERKKSLLRALQNSFAQVEVKDYSSAPLDSLHQSIDYSYRFKAARAAYLGEKTLVFRFPWSDGLKTFHLPGERDRNYELQAWRRFGFWGGMIHESTIQLPSKLSLLDHPRPIDLNGKWGRYKLEFKIERNRIVARREFIPFQKDILPSEYPSYRAFLEKIVEADNGYLVFKLKE